MTDLSLYGTISMSLIIGLLVGLIVLALLDRGDASEADTTSIFGEARADQLRRRAILGTPDLPPRDAGIMLDVTAPGRHRALDVAMTMSAQERRPSLARAGLNEALAWLAVDRVKREAERTAFKQLLMASRFRSGVGPKILAGRL